MKERIPKEAFQNVPHDERGTTDSNGVVIRGGEYFDDKPNVAGFGFG